MTNEADAAKDRLIKELETENKQLKIENEQLKTENEHLKSTDSPFIVGKRNLPPDIPNFYE